MLRRMPDLLCYVDGYAFFESIRLWNLTAVLTARLNSRPTIFMKLMSVVVANLHVSAQDAHV